MRTESTRAGVSLRRLFPDSVTLYAGDIRATSCTSNAFTVRPGDVYVALDAGDLDGHDSVDEAIARGADAIVVERAVAQTRVPACLVPDTRTAFGRLCQALAGDPSESLSCIGVTGTDGKTITSRLVQFVLREGGAEVAGLDDCSFGGVCGRVAAGRRAWDSESAGLQSAPQLAATLAEFAADRASHAVLEVSSKALSEHVLSGVRLDAACFTNLGRAHLDRHNSLKSYREVKCRLLEHLRPGGVCVLNVDDPIAARLTCRAPGPVLTFAMDNQADVTAELLERNTAEQSFLLTAEMQSVVVRTRCVGDHHVQNCLLAATVGLAAGIDLARIARGIERYEGLPGRLERIGRVGGPAIYLDVASTPTALAAALDAVRLARSGRVWCVADVPATGDDDELARFGAALACLADRAIVTPRDDDPERRRDLCHLIAGIERPDHVVVVSDRRQALAAAIGAAGSADAVLIVGASGELDIDRLVVSEIQEGRTHFARSSLALS